MRESHFPLLTARRRGVAPGQPRLNGWLAVIVLISVLALPPNLRAGPEAAEWDPIADLFPLPPWEIPWAPGDAAPAKAGNRGSIKPAAGDGDCPTNVVLSLTTELCWIADNFFQGANTLATVLPSPTVGTVLYKWDSTNQMWVTNNFLSPGVWDDPAMTLLPGEGAAIWSPSPQTVSFGGTPPVHPPPSIDAPQRPYPKWYLVGGRSNCPNTFEQFMGFPPQAGDQVYLPACGATNLDEAPRSTVHVFVRNAWDPVEPILDPGKAAMVQLATTNANSTKLSIKRVNSTEVEITWPDWAGLDLHKASGVKGPWVPQVASSPLRTTTLGAASFFQTATPPVSGSILPGAVTNSCCGAATGRAIFARTSGLGWGWQQVPAGGPYRACACASDACIVWVSTRGGSGCATHCVDIPYSQGALFRFTVFFKSAPPANCSLTLVGFLP